MGIFENAALLNFYGIYGRANSGFRPLAEILFRDTQRSYQNKYLFTRNVVYCRSCSSKTTNYSDLKFL